MLVLIHIEKQTTAAIEIDPEDWIPYSNRGVAYGLQGNYALAIEDYTKSLEILPNDADAHFNRGVAFGRQGQRIVLV